MFVQIYYSFILLFNTLRELFCFSKLLLESTVNFSSKFFYQCPTFKLASFCYSLTFLYKFLYYFLFLFHSFQLYHLIWFIVNSLFLFPNYCFKSVWKSSIIGNFKLSFFKSFITSFFYIPADSLYIYDKTHLICSSTKIFLIFILI